MISVWSRDFTDQWLGISAFISKNSDFKRRVIRQIISFFLKTGQNFRISKMRHKNAKTVEKSGILHIFLEFERFDPFSKSVHNMTNHAPLRAVILRDESCDSELSIREIAG